MIRILGAVIFLIGLLMLIADLVTGLTSGSGIEIRALGSWWAEVDRDSLLLLQPAVERHLSPALWDPGIQTLLEWPAAPQFMTLGAVIWLIGRLVKARTARSVADGEAR
ncbi:hypothetical protein KHP62_19915 [Rhodobacteraceae bacterium NNCM2]|nr:hypothetical protein [Coraliihabitans acroporae]